MQGNRSKGTDPEMRLRALLRKAGYPGYRLHWNVPGRPDIAYPGRRIAIFVNGCFWHRCPSCNPPMPNTNKEFWAAKFAQNQARDAFTAAKLTDDGWTVVTLWECELRKAPEAALSKVLEALGARRAK